MDSKTKKYLLAGGVVVAAGAAWYFLAGPGATSSTGPTPAVSTGLSNQTMIAAIVPWVQQYAPQLSTQFAAALTGISQSDLNNLYATLLTYGVNQATMPAALWNWWTTFGGTWKLI